MKRLVPSLVLAESYEIRDGRLLVFYKDPAVDARDLWRKEPETLYRKAEGNWPGLSK
jgi:hypothetical protein